ncbi:MAG TPA: hypothetical protein H9895_00600, partial [Candidatus Pseudogracilibacillus intestinigallinarum]|nr:hypothetical protein [Candidatus Pseudogracilibacillus intestinigallinarum]
LTHYDKIVVDDFEQVENHGVDVSYRACNEGYIAKESIVNLGEIIVNNKVGRLSKEDKILFNPIGMSIHDVSEAFRVYLNAKKKGIGVKLPLWEHPYWF